MDLLAIDEMIWCIEGSLECLLSTKDDKPKSSGFSCERIFDNIPFLHEAEPGEVLFQLLITKVFWEASNKNFPPLFSISFGSGLFPVKCRFDVDLRLVSAYIRVFDGVAS